MNKHTKEIIKFLFIIICLIIIIVYIGTMGFKHFFGMSYIDAIYNASITATSLGVDARERTSGEKIFTSLYALISGLFFITMISAIISYIFSIYYIRPHC